MWYMYAMEYYSAIKIIKFRHLQLEMKWMKLENIIFSEISQRKIILISLMWNLKNYTDECICKTETDSQI